MLQVGGSSSSVRLGGPTSAPLEIFSATTQLSHHHFASSSDSSLNHSKHKHEASCHIPLPDYPAFSANRSSIKIMLAKKTSSQDNFCRHFCFSKELQVSFNFPVMTNNPWFGYYPTDLQSIAGNGMNSSTKGHARKQYVAWKPLPGKPETNCPCLS